MNYANNLLKLLPMVNIENANELIKTKIDGIFLLIIYMIFLKNAMVGETNRF
jgi:hypothetical protein